MGKLLFDESPLVVQPTLAKAIGLNEAIVLQQIHYWLKGNKSGKEIDGVRWIYNSLSDWQEQFPFWSESTIYRTLKALEEKSLIKIGRFNQRKGDRTQWFTIAYNEVASLEAGGGRNSIIHNETSSSQDETTLPETSPEITSPLSQSEQEGDETPSLKQQALETLEKAFGMYGGSVNPRMVEELYKTIDANPDHPQERLQHALKRLSEKRNFFRAVDGYREWSLPKPPTYPQRREQFSRPSAPAPEPYRPKTPEEVAAFHAKLAATRAAMARGSP